VPVRLADNTVVSARGREPVMLYPVVNGLNASPVTLSRVLHVPALQNNLLSILHLVSAHSYRVIIEKSTLEFWEADLLRFTASICHNTAFIDGSSSGPLERAQPAQEMLDRSLWHRRFGHISAERLERHISESLGDGLVVHSSNPLPQIFPELCLGVGGSGHAEIEGLGLGEEVWRVRERGMRSGGSTLIVGGVGALGGSESRGGDGK
jgi:hypothetical protein